MLYKGSTIVFKTFSSPSKKLVVNIMTMLYLFISLFASQLLLATSCVIEKEQVENSEEPPSLELNKTISESPDPETTEAPWTNIDFTLEDAEHDVDTCQGV